MSKDKRDNGRGHGNVTHGVYSFLKNNQLPTGRGMKKVEQYMQQLEKDLVDQLGGYEQITPQQEILIRSTMKAFQVQTLIELWINEVGPINPRKANTRKEIELQPVLAKSYLSYMNSIRLNLAQLFPGGLARNVEKPMDLSEYIKENYEEEAK